MVLSETRYYEGLHEVTGRPTFRIIRMVLGFQIKSAQCWHLTHGSIAKSGIMPDPAWQPCEFNHGNNPRRWGAASVRRMVLQVVSFTIGEMGVCSNEMPVIARAHRLCILIMAG
jgi:hypothetical protein